MPLRYPLGLALGGQVAYRCPMPNSHEISFDLAVPEVGPILINALTDYVASLRVEADERLARGDSHGAYIAEIAEQTLRMAEATRNVYELLER